MLHDPLLAVTGILSLTPSSNGLISGSGIEDLGQGLLTSSEWMPRGARG